MFVAVVGGCIVWLQEQSSQYRLLIAMSKYDVHQAALATSLVQCLPFLASCSQFACTFASLLSIRGGFPYHCLHFSLVATTGSPCMMIQQNGTLMMHILMALTSLEFFHFFSNICIYIRTAEIQLSFHCVLKQEQGKYWSHYHSFTVSQY
jgi:hypothetical protein